MASCRRTRPSPKPAKPPASPSSVRRRNSCGYSASSTPHARWPVSTACPCSKARNCWTRSAMRWPPPHGSAIRSCSKAPPAAAASACGSAAPTPNWAKPSTRCAGWVRTTSATPACSSRSTSNAPAISKCRCSATAVARCWRWACATVRCSGATRKCWRKRRRPICPKAWPTRCARPRSGWRGRCPTAAPARSSSSMTAPRSSSTSSKCTPVCRSSTA